jgi:hypothetical protein
MLLFILHRYFGCLLRSFRASVVTLVQRSRLDECVADSSSRGHRWICEYSRELRLLPEEQATWVLSTVVRF